MSTGELRRLPLRERHLAAGARMSPFAGWEMPLQYTGILAEHAAVRTDVGIFDVSHMGRVRVAAGDAGARIRAITTYDVARMRAGRAHYSLYCTPDGGIADDVMVYRLDDARWLIVHNADHAEADAARVRAAAGAAASDVGRETVMLAIQGPRALDLLAGVLADGVRAIGLRRCGELTWRGAGVFVGRTGYTGEDGVECILEPAAGGELWDACVAAGARPCGLGARDTLRLEAALPLHGHDISPETDPYAAGLGWTVTLDDGVDFIGRAALVALAEREPPRRLSCLRLLDRGVPRAGYAVRAGDVADGLGLVTLTSGAFSPTLRVGIAMAYLPAAVSAPGTRLAIAIHGRDVPAEVVARPFYRRDA
ncbi:MAG: glycine cleavage system aminomethyltransferase GcvT [Dehalococcoidia bacterium]